MTDELEIDLQVLDRKLQVGEAPEAGAEVIECEFAAEPGEAARERLARVEILHQRGLGDLEDELRGVRARLAELAGDQGQQLFISDRSQRTD